MMQYRRTCHILLRCTFAFINKGSKLSSHLSSDNMDCELYIDCTTGTLKHLDYSTMPENCINHMKNCSDVNVMSFLSKPQDDDLSAITKQFIYPQGRSNFLLQVWSHDHHMLQKRVDCCWIRSFCTNENFLAEKGSTEEAVTGNGLINEVITDKNVSEKMGNEQTIYSEITKKEPYVSQKRMINLASLLHCSVNKMKILTKKYAFFNHLAPELIKTKVNIMVCYGLPYSFVSANPRLLYQTSAQELHKRLELFQTHSFLSDNSVISLENLAHCLECRNDYFLYLFHKLCAEKEALEGCIEQLDYLQFRLRCPKEEANELLSTKPLRDHYSNVRLKRLLDFFLIEAKIGPQFVIKYRRLLCYSVQRLQTRWKVIQLNNIFSEAMIIQIFEMTNEKFYSTYSDLRKGT